MKFILSSLLNRRVENATWHELFIVSLHFVNDGVVVLEIRNWSEEKVTYNPKSTISVGPKWWMVYWNS